MPTTTWDLAGNTGNTAAAFLGTTDAQPLVLKTVSVERVRIDKDGNVGIGTSTPRPSISGLSTLSAMPETSRSTV